LCHSRTLLAGIHGSEEWIPAMAGMTSLILKTGSQKIFEITFFVISADKTYDHWV
jgi:hypothetical protein